MAWSGQQEVALREVSEWRANPSGKQVYRLFGFAGTGKSTLAKAIAESVDGPVVFGAFTGKAADVMRSKGCVGASTIHSLIYSPVENEWGGTEFFLNYDSPVQSAKLTIIDECSMVDKRIGMDLLSFGTPILVLGDPAQLPPVKGQGFFTHGEDCEPDVMLTEIHRQAAGNPIIHMATKVRKGEKLDLGAYGENRVIARKDMTSNDVLAADQLIVGRNRTRILWNTRFRELKGYDPNRPQVGEKLICLKNSYQRGVLNGTTWAADKITSAKESWNLWVRPFDENTTRKATQVKVRKEFFTGREDELEDDVLKRDQQFTYGHAITCHKAQGSQFGSVVVLDESGVFREEKDRWLYTAISRASEKLVIAR